MDKSMRSRDDHDGDYSTDDADDAWTVMMALKNKLMVNHRNTHLSTLSKKLLSLSSGLNLVCWEWISVNFNEF